MTLYISDLDGTLLNKNDNLSEETIKMLKTKIEEGLQFTIATGRSLFYAKKYIDELGIKLPVVLSNGVYVYDPVSQEYLTKNSLDYETAMKFLKLCDEQKFQTFIYAINDNVGERIYHKKLLTGCMKQVYYRRIKFGDRRQTLIDTYNTINDKVITSISILDKEAILRPLYEEVRKKFSVISYFMEDHHYPGYFWLEIYGPNTSKGDGVEYIKNLLNAKNTVCFGDSNNDISMFEVAHRAYAVANASDFVKGKAHGVIGTNNENSVARFIINDC